ncbi:MAG: hypothetical protein ACOX2R_00855 [Anaerolineae bacterium]|jgi:hypothetical protein
METTEQNGRWQLGDLLSELMEATAETTPEPRAEIWASDLGKPFVDRWLQMRGVPYSNPATGKDLVTYFLGKQIELGIATMLSRCGIPHQRQERLSVRMEGCLPVVGRPDLVLAVRDWQEVMEGLDERLDREPREHAESPVERQAIRALLASWQRRRPEGLGPMVFEVKSLNSWAYRYHRDRDGLSNAYPHHKLQLYTYLRGLGLQEGHLLYVARDTGWIEEVIVREDETLAQAWLEDVTTMSAYFRGDERPPLEPRQIAGKENWRVTYSRYKDYLYQEVPHGAFAF